MPSVFIEMTIEQAQAVERALDVFTRLSLGQLDVLNDLVRTGSIPAYVASGDTRRPCADETQCADFQAFMEVAKRRLGYPASFNYRHGHRNVPVSGERCYEIQTVLSKALAQRQSQNTAVRSIPHSGPIVRYTQDPTPHVEVQE